MPRFQIPQHFLMSRLLSIGALSAFALVGALGVLALSSSTRAIWIFLIGVLSLAVLPVCFVKARSVVRAVVRSFTWYKALLLLLLASGLVFRLRDAETAKTNPLDGWALFRVALVSITGSILCLRLALRQTNWHRYLFRGLVGILAAYAFICILSSIWSVYPSWTLYRSVEYLVDVAVLAAIVASLRSVQEYKRLFDWTWLLYGLLLASVWLGLVFWPKDALQPVWGIVGFDLSGVVPYIHPNSVGELGALVGSVALCRLLLRHLARSDQIFYGVLLALATGTMALAQGRSAILGFAVATILILLFSRRVGTALLLVGACAILLSMGNFQESFTAFMRRGEDTSELRSLSGRLNWWQFAWPKFLANPILGYGSYAGSRFFVSAQAGVDPGGIHSDWLETLIGAGLLGFLPAVIVFVRAWWQLAKSLRSSALTELDRYLATEAIGVLGMISVRSFFSQVLFWHPPIIFLVIIGYADFLQFRASQRTLKRPGSLAPAFNQSG
jgi:O-antigen ligase